MTHHDPEDYLAERGTCEFLVPASRIRTCNSAPVRFDAELVLYWTITFRRLSSNPRLQRAVELAIQLQKSLVMFEPLRIGYRRASDLIHRFVLDGMAENGARIDLLKNPGVLDSPPVKQLPDAVAVLARCASVIGTDDFPSFFPPRRVAAAAASAKSLARDSAEFAALPIDHSVSIVETRGGSTAARQGLTKFLDQHLPHYAVGANDPDPDADNRMGLSPYPRFGHISPHEFFDELMTREEWSPASILGNIRYMSSDSTRKKICVDAYLKAYS